VAGNGKIIHKKIVIYALHIIYSFQEGLELQFDVWDFHVFSNIFVKGGSEAL